MAALPSALEALGLLLLARIAAAALLFLYRLALRPAFDLKKRYGEGWALVTGATDGIGKAMATELAKTGFSVLLVSRTQAKLDEVAKELQASFPLVKIDTLAVDFAQFSLKDQEAVRTKVETMKSSGGLCVLVNNVGVAYDYPMFFHELSTQEVSSLLRINCDSTALMTHICLPFIRDRQGKVKKGAIINVASASGLCSMPLLAEYSAAKAFVIRFTEGLAAEYPSLDLNCQAPYYIVSKLSKFKRASLTVPTPESYAVLALDCVGYETVSNPHWAHALMEVVVARLFPTSWVDGVLLNMHLGIRSKALKKKAQ